MALDMKSRGGGVLGHSNVTTTRLLQASAGLGYANVKMMQYDVKHSGENKMMDAAEIVKCASQSVLPEASIMKFNEMCEWARMQYFIWAALMSAHNPPLRSSVLNPCASQYPSETNCRVLGYLERNFTQYLCCMVAHTCSQSP